MLYKSFQWLSFFASIIFLISCSNPASNSPPPIPRVAVDVSVIINWETNREIAVNSVNGGYKVFYSETTPVTTNSKVVDVPYDLVANVAPTTVDINFTLSGRYYFAVQAYSSLNFPSGSQSKLSDEFSLNIN